MEGRRHIHVPRRLRHRRGRRGQGGVAWYDAPENAQTERDAATGAVLTGRRTSDAARAWGGQHPAGIPTYVVSHRPTTSTPAHRDA